jgi:endonuclease/exonuclease/phosphatase family metal-dependent hydrolase
MKLVTMKRKSILFVCLAAALVISACKKQSEPVKVITFNIRYDNARDSINAWPNRKAIVCSFLKEEKPDLFGLQEALWYQYEAIDSALTGYSSVAAGRDDGNKKGEMNPVFYSTLRFEHLADSTFWLSPSPGIPGSKGWGASLPRIVTFVKLRYKISGGLLWYFNTHFAHDSDSARVMSAEILKREVEKISGKDKFIITGDFNTAPDSRAYSILTGSIKGKPFLQDSYVISRSVPTGPEGTFNGWSDKEREGRIDYVFVRGGMKADSVKTAVIKENGVFISDHWPVIASVRYR